jgi:hypothetical protein
MLETAPMAQDREGRLCDPGPVTPPQFRMRPEKLSQKHIGWSNAGQEPTHRILK